MNKKEAKKLLEQGKKVRGKNWSENEYIFLDEDGRLRNQDNELEVLDYNKVEYEEYIKIKNDEISNWDLTMKLLNNNKSEIHIIRNIDGLTLFITSNCIPKDKIYILSKVNDIKDNQTIKEYINSMTIYNFMLFYEGLKDLLESIQDSKIKYEKLIEEYQKES